MILDARPYVEQKMKELKERVQKLDKIPTLAILQVAGDKASNKYVDNKMKKCEEAGINVRYCFYGEEVSQEALKIKIDELNSNDDVTGILLQLPLPAHLDAEYLTNQIAPEKDVDGLTFANAGKLSQGLPCNVACTPKGIMELLDFYHITIESKDVLIINDSNIVGKPLAQLFLQRGATVTIAHKKTLNLRRKILSADIVITAVGIKDFLKATDIFPRSVVIDVSINFNEQGKMCGDIRKEDYEILSRHCHFTPVPFGVGQTTVMALLDNLVSILEK